MNGCENLGMSTARKQPVMNAPFLKPEEQVLSTLRGDGSRRWLKPRLSTGGFLTRRRLVAYLLIVVFTALPFVHVGGKPFVLLDIPARRFTLFFYTFLPTDTVLLALFLVGTLLAIFLITALFGRVWCGWACPQTVYMEFLFRPIERFFDGTTGRGGEPKSKRPGWIRSLKYPAYLLACFYLANTFLAYFVGVETLWQWMHQSPFHHPIPFLVMGFVVVAMMLDFGYFREQVCIIMCPYGRFQSVLLDQSSLIVSYDSRRGEPRGKKRKQAEALPVSGDCVDCGNCVTTCPTGIDIRKGLQMECINCTQCIDACNVVMHKLGRAPNLIRYSNQMMDRGERSNLLRPRVFIYPTILLVVGGLFLAVLLSKQGFNVRLLREGGSPFSLMEDGLRVRNLMQMKLVNRTDKPLSFTLAVDSPASAELMCREQEIKVPANKTGVFHLEILAPRSEFRAGRLDFKLRIRSDAGNEHIETIELVGP
jgi:cytochrome c oxidase accessory protein FixG